MKIWIAFLFLSFVVGGRSVRTGKKDRLLVMLAVCFVISASFYTYRGI